MIYCIGDTHFGHKNIISFEPEKRPFASIEEHNEQLVRNWNETVKPDDTVIHLGDVFFRKESQSYAKRLSGKKILVMGNHDHYLKASEYEEIFDTVCGVYTRKNVIMTHYPVHESQFYRYKLNIHGHTHSRCIPDKRYFNASVENIGLKPIPLNDILKNIE